MTTPRPNVGERPTHPKLKASLLMVGVVLAIVALAAISTFAGH
jgi:hypothetical protein